ncbi:MAG TPA: GAF domain-containing sensor histidine kinase [Anaerolineales bacterium]|nr:GAF domain-containing sensor histidine kinase [Anaerolineales bacterium]
MTTGPLRDLDISQDQLKRLVELSVTLNSTLDLDDLLQLITTTAAELLDCEAASILLYDERKPRLYFAAATGSDPARLAEVPVPIDNSLAGTIFRTNQYLILNNAEDDPRHYSLVSDHIKFNVKSLLGVPMSIKDRTVGVLEAVNKRGGVFEERDATLLSVLAAHAAIAIDNARLLQTTKKALQQVKDSDRLKSTFLSLASHELRTPLGIIIGYSTFLKEDGKGEQSVHASQVLAAARQMRSILDEMNNLAMLKSDEMILKPQKIPIQSVLASACEGIKDMAHTHDQRLVTAFSNEPLYVRVDVNKMTLAFSNLLNNALRFSPAGTDITVGAIRDDHQVLIWVQDHGRGIPVDQLQRIFEEFYQIESPDKRSYGGLGIGLTLARGLIEAQGGRIWAESDGPGAGSTFKVLLPVVPLKP